MTLVRSNVYKPNIVAAKPLKDQRISFVVMGPPGTGKSTLCGSMAEVVGNDRTLVIATLAREKNSWKYVENQVPSVLIEDKNWNPSQKQFDATGFPEFLQLCRWLREEDDQYDAIILDSGTELAELGWHAALAPHSVGSPAEMDGKSRWLPYETLANSADQGIKELVSLTTVAKRPKHVGVTWHVQPPKDDTVESVGSGTDRTSRTKESADNAAQGVEYEGKILPMIRGQYRRKLTSQFDTVVYTDVRIDKKTEQLPAGKFRVYEEVSYRLQVRPDADRHTKVPGPLPQMVHIPNSFNELLKIVHNAKVAATVTAPSPTPSPSR